MERQSSTVTSSSPKSTTAASPPSQTNNGAAPQATSPTNVKRRKRKSSWILFAVLRAFAVLGPLGFIANLVYFQFFVHTSNNHSTHNSFHPFHGVSSNFRARVEQHHQSVSRDHDSPDQENSNIIKKKLLEDSPIENKAAPPALVESKKKPILSGLDVLQRLQEQATSSWKDCGSDPKSTVALTKQLKNEPQGNLRASSNVKEGLLQPFALRESLPQHMNEMQHHNDTTLQQCWIPQRGTLDCDAESYSIIVTFQGQKNFRPLFMNLLAWLTYPYISDIVVLMPHADWATTEHTIMDAKYKERIKTWHGTKTHKVSMIGIPKTIEEDPTSKYSFDSLLKKIMSKVQSDAVLFMDGSIFWNGNNRGITAGFELWKQNPHGIIATHKLHTGAPQSFCQKNAAGSLWTPFCQQESSRLPTDLATLHQQYQNILDLNGVFVHKGMLCLLRQDPMASILRRNVWQSLDDNRNAEETFAYARSILSIALLQIAGSPPLLFPPTIARPSNETQDYNNNWHYLPHISELEYLEELTANNTRIQKRTLLSLLGYFGNGLVANANEGDMVPYWCTAQKQVEGVFFITDIPWMENHKCKRVAADADLLKPVM